MEVQSRRALSTCTGPGGDSTSPGSLDLASDQDCASGESVHGRRTAVLYAPFVVATREPSSAPLCTYGSAGLARSIGENAVDSTASILPAISQQKREMREVRVTEEPCLYMTCCFAYALRRLFDPVCQHVWRLES